MKKKNWLGSNIVEHGAFAAAPGPADESAESAERKGSSEGVFVSASENDKAMPSVKDIHDYVDMLTEVYGGSRGQDSEHME